MAELLFVYGTLRSCFDNDWACALRARGVFVGNATAPGSIYRVEFFPAYKAAPAGTVHGEVYEVPESLFELLDDYEGDQFTRVSVTLFDRRVAWVYAYSGEPSAASRIESGDFSKE